MKILHLCLLSVIIIILFSGHNMGNTYFGQFFNSLTLTNYPNPFDNRSELTTILFWIENETNIELKIYDLFGNLVKVFNIRQVKPGINSIIWDGTNEAGDKVSKGGYILVLESSNDFSKILAIRKIGVIH